MGAGNAGSTQYNTNVNLNTFGGSKKQGITSRVGLDNWGNMVVQMFSNGYGRNKLFCMNQIGGVGAGQSMFNGRFTQKDGTHCFVPNTSLYSVASNSDGTKLVVVLKNGGIYTSSNSGSSWFKTSAPDANWSDVASNAMGTRLVAVVKNGGIYLSTNSGNTWSKTSAPIASWESVSSDFTGTKLVAAIEDGGIYTYSDSIWTKTDAPNAKWDSVASDSMGAILIAVAYGGGLYVSTDSGNHWTQKNTWTTITGDINHNWSVATNMDGTQIVVAVEYGGIYSSNDLGDTWTNTLAPDALWESVALNSNGIVAVVQGGGIYTYSNSIWSKTSAPNANWDDVASDLTGIHLVAIDDKYVYTSLDSGATWQKVRLIYT